MQRTTGGIAQRRCRLLFLITAIVGCNPSAPTDRSGGANVPAVRAADVGQSSSTVVATVAAAKSPGDADLSVAVTSEMAEHSGGSSNAASQFRHADDRPPLDELLLSREGIQVYRSKRLILLSDCPAGQVEALPQLADQLFESLESRLGVLLPAKNGEAFQLTGCVMDAEERFRNAGLLPEFEFAIRHGRHLNYRFWMRNVTSDYYRRHLLLHEFTHCFLMCENGMQDIPPLWYTEGIAEYFATHDASAANSDAVRFGVLPKSIDQHSGWGRISEIRRSFNERPIGSPLPAKPAEPALPKDWDAGFTPLSSVLQPQTPLFVQDLQYAQAWALYWLLEHHPALDLQRKEFHPVRTAADFQAAIQQLYPELQRLLAVDWLLFQDSLIEGFDADHGFPQRPAVLEVAQSHETNCRIAAQSGWQFTGLTAKSGSRLAVHSSGRFTIATDPQPWISEPQGVTIRYHRGRPLGELSAMLVAPDGSRASRRIPVGTSVELIVPFEAEIWLQLNDSAASRSDNQGSVDVTMTTSQ